MNITGDVLAKISVILLTVILMRTLARITVYLYTNFCIKSSVQLLLIISSNCTLEEFLANTGLGLKMYF